MAAQKQSGSNMAATKGSHERVSFDGNAKAWTTFKMKFSALMLKDGHSEALLHEAPDPMGDQLAYDLYAQRNSQVYAALVLCTSGVALELIAGAPQYDGYRAWQTLLHKYEQPSIARGVDLHRELMTTKLEEEADPDLYFTTVEELRRQIEATGIPVDLLQLRCIIHANLPTTYNALMPTLNTIPLDNYGSFKDTIRTHYNSQVKRHRGGVQQQIVTDAHAMAASSNRCSFCHRLGHSVQTCRVKNKSSVICWQCNKRGYLKKDCRSTQPVQQALVSQENTALVNYAC